MPGLQPDAGDRVLAAAGGIGAAILVELLLAKRGLDLDAPGPEPRLRASGFAGFSLDALGGLGLDNLWLLGLGAVSAPRSASDLAGAFLARGSSYRPSYAPTLFLRFMPATSSGFGALAAVRMLGAVVEVQGAHLVAAERAARDHALDGLFKDALGEAAFEDLARRSLP